MASSVSLFLLTLLLTLFVSDVFSASDFYCHRNSEGHKRVDRCGQMCVCRSGRWLCTRVRKEFTTMSDVERIVYVDTIRKASMHPDYKAAYDKLITEHRTLFETGIHNITHFLPWHRYFIWRYENLLRKIDCHFTVAYWDWGMDSGHPWMMDTRDVWSPFNNGFGGNGTEPSQCVQTGRFREEKWKLTPSAAPPTCLRRRFNGNPPDTVAILQLLRTSHTEFTIFEVCLRLSFHDNVHCLINGTMCTNDSANAPEFFLHHGFIDKIWEDWQRKSSAHRYAFYPNIKERMPGTPYLPSAFLDLADHPDGVRVMYNKRRDTTTMMKKYRGFSVKMLSHLPGRHKFSFRNDAAMKLFHVSADEQEIAKICEDRFSPPGNPIG